MKVNRQKEVTARVHVVTQKTVTYTATHPRQFCDWTRWRKLYRPIGLPSSVT